MSYELFGSIINDANIEKIEWEDPCGGLPLLGYFSNSVDDDERPVLDVSNLKVGTCLPDDNYFSNVADIESPVLRFDAYDDLAELQAGCCPGSSSSSSSEPESESESESASESSSEPESSYSDGVECAVCAEFGYSTPKYVKVTFADITVPGNDVCNNCSLSDRKWTGIFDPNGTYILEQQSGSPNRICSYELLLDVDIEFFHYSTSDGTCGGCQRSLGVITKFLIGVGLGSIYPTDYFIYFIPCSKTIDSLNANTKIFAYGDVQGGQEGNCFDITDVANQFTSEPGGWPCRNIAWGGTASVEEL